MIPTPAIIPKPITNPKSGCMVVVVVVDIEVVSVDIPVVSVVVLVGTTNDRIMTNTLSRSVFPY